MSTCLKPDKFSLKSQSGIEVKFHPTGAMQSIKDDEILINQVITHIIDGSMSNIYLRVYQDNEIQAFPLLGMASRSKFYVGKHSVKWIGQVNDIHYEIIFELSKTNSVWFYRIDISGPDHVQVDLVYGQDVGIANLGALQSNEAYVSQYIDYSIHQSEVGYAITARQNQKQSNNSYPYLQIGSLTSSVGFTTDGYQFFGTQYRMTNEPEVLKYEKFPNEVYQYEFGYISLVTEKFNLSKKPKRHVFYGYYKKDHPTAVTQLEYRETIEKSYENLLNERETYTERDKIHSIINQQRVIHGQQLTSTEVEELYPKRLLEENINQKMCSFFTSEYRHIVLQDKEMHVERSHGHILFNGGATDVDKHLITSTVWMNGVFNAQIAFGNTSMNKFTVNLRNSLNVLKSQGQRIYIQVGEKYQLLGVPSLFEIDLNAVKWIYKLDDDVIEIINFSSSKDPVLQLEVKSLKGKRYNFILTDQIILDEKEYNSIYKMETVKDFQVYSPGENSVINWKMPALKYAIKVSATDNFSFHNEADLLNLKTIESPSLNVIRISNSDKFTLTISASEKDDFHLDKMKDVKERKKFRQYITDLTKSLSIEIPDDAYNSHKMNATITWYTHNMLVHYLVPHGLEQYGGAAWGTRDVSQGPIEYFLAMQHFEIARNILLRIYKHQFIEDGNWPQWFMFDEYQNIQADESHGDIIVWPLKVVNQYLKVTEDYSVFEEKLTYTSRKTKEFTADKETLLDHIKKQIHFIETHFLEGTYLSSYSDGDWNDTLQPSQAELKEKMASAWTVELTYQAFNDFLPFIQKVDEKLSEKVKHLRDGIYKDFHEYIMDDVTVPGFVFDTFGNNFEKIIHPSDKKTNISYRLLPMTRGMISGIFTDKQVRHHLDLINNYLLFPDGAHLMNKPAPYHGGVSNYFQRAEQAANFGREVGLNYIHAHIRYIEAMTTLGKADEAWRAVHQINPINIMTVVSNAEPRQSNTYFSSSDGKFNTRYDAAANFSLLQKGEVPVKGGWRIYSSGPGIYLNQLVSNVFGIRVKRKGLVLDPVLPEKLDGLKIQFAYKDIPIIITYVVADADGSKVLLNNKDIDFDSEEKVYREGGVVISETQIKDAKNSLRDNDVLEIRYEFVLDTFE